MFRDLSALGRIAPRSVAGWIALPAACLLSAMLSFAHGGTIRHDRDDSLYLDLAADAAFASVGRFTWSEGGSGYLASGTLIRDDWVLTAAHVVGGTNDMGGGVSNLRFRIGGTNYTADEWIPHEEWAASGGADGLDEGWDIGLVHLANEVGGITPAELYLPEYGSELGLTGTQVGFGDTGTGQTGYQSGPSNMKRAGDNVLDVVGTAETPSTPNQFNHNRLIAVDFDNPGSGSNPFGSGTPLNLEYLVAPGDSGGGLFLDVEGEMKLAGVTSYIFATDGDADSDYGDRAAFTRVSQFLDWIDEIIGVEEPELLIGDYNADGVVDAADYSVWRDAMESGGSGLPNDPSPELVDDSDYDRWREHFGQFSSESGGSGGSSATPEPGSLALWLMGLLALIPRRR